MTRALLTKEDVKQYLYDITSSFLDIKIINKKQLLKMFNITEGTYVKYVKDGLPYFREGKYVLFNLKEVKSWIKNYTKATKSSQ